MIDPDRIYFSYSRPQRTPQTARSCASALAFSAVNAVLAVNAYRNPDLVPVLFASVNILLAIVGFVIGAGLGWSWIAGSIHEVRVTDDGIDYDRQFWPWASVVSIRSRRAAKNRRASLEILVNRSPWRSQLTLPIDAHETDDDDAVTKLKDYLADTNPAIRWL